MKNLFLRLAALCLLLPVASHARTRDSLSHRRMALVAVPLVIGGTAMNFCDRDFRELRNGYAAHFHHDYDNYLQYAPLALTYRLKACGMQSRSSWERMAVSNAFSVSLMAATVNALKYTVRVERPDGSARNSFPSGHAATAFMAATILHKEYGHRSPWFSIAGYTAATATGIARILNNRHWMSDVAVGAGIGILSVELGYSLAGLIYGQRGISDVGSPENPDCRRALSFLSLQVGATTAVGRYSALSDHRIRFAGGPSVGVRGAWFATPHLGVGGRLSVGNMRMTIDGEAQPDAQCPASAAAGLCFALPLTARCSIGSHFLGGYARYKHMQSPWGGLGGRGGALIGTGLSMTLVAAAHLGVRFSADYDLVSPVLQGSEEWLHNLTVGIEVCTLF